MDPRVTVRAAVILAQRLHDEGASPEEITAVAERFAALHAEEEEPAAVSESIEWVWLEESRRQEGEVWKGPSGRYFTIKSGHVVPAKTPGGEGAADGRGGTPDQSADAREPASVVIHPEVQRVAQKLFGKQLSEDDYRNIACAPPGATVHVQARRGTITVSGQRYNAAGDPDFNAVRTISRGGFFGFGTVTCQNVAFGLKGERKGAGADLFAHQVEAMAKAGVTRITTHAAGMADAQGKAEGGNGYYTWPRLGYSGKMSEDKIARLPPDIRQALAGKRDVLDLMALPGGAKAWETTGSSMMLSFDLRDGSPNRRALQKYMTERAHGEG